jgi:hypothetical protein
LVSLFFSELNKKIGEHCFVEFKLGYRPFKHLLRKPCIQLHNSNTGDFIRQLSVSLSPRYLLHPTSCL